MVCVARAGVTQRIAGAAQICIATVLTGVSMAFMWQLLSEAYTDYGFDPTNVYVVELQPPDPTRRFTVTPGEIIAAREHRRAVIEGLPGIDVVTFASAVPGRVAQFSSQVPKPGGLEGDAVRATVISADVGYTELLGMTMLHGHARTAADTDGVLVNQTLARRLWERENVVGEPITQSRRQMRVVGVLRDAPFAHPAEEIQPMVFALIAPGSFRDAIVVGSTDSRRRSPPVAATPGGPGDAQHRHAVGSAAQRRLAGVTRV